MADGRFLIDAVNVMANINCNSATSEANALQTVWQSLPLEKYTFGVYSYSGLHEYLGYKTMADNKEYGIIMSFKYSGNAWIYFVNNGTGTLKALSMTNA